MDRWDRFILILAIFFIMAGFHLSAWGPLAFALATLLAFLFVSRGTGGNGRAKP